MSLPYYWTDNLKALNVFGVIADTLEKEPDIKNSLLEFIGKNKVNIYKVKVFKHKGDDFHIIVKAESERDIEQIETEVEYEDI